MTCSETVTEHQAEVLRLIGELVSGLAAPYSISMEITRGHPERHFGVGADAWVKLRDALHLFGYPQADEVGATLRRELGLDQLPQRQDSLTDQLRDLIPVANRWGCYDAADFLRVVVGAGHPRLTSP
jgi:hypothetical protein